MPGVGSALEITPTLAVARRTWVKTLRRPVVLTFSFVQPLIWMALFGFLFQRFPVSDAGLTRGGSAVRYLDFLAPGISVMTVLLGASQAGVTWIRDLQTGFLPRLLLSPASHHAVLGGKVLADVSRLLLQALGVLLLALLLGARLTFAPLALLAALPALLAFAVALACLSSWIALATRAQESMAVFVHLVNMPLLFTSTALVPSKQMPAWLAEIARYNPLTLTADAWRGALLAGEAPELTGSLLGQTLPLLLLAVALYLLAARAMRRVGEGIA